MTSLLTEPAISDTTIIRDIGATMAEYRQTVQQTRSKDGALAPARQLHRAEAPHREMIRQAAHLFGRLNGWRTGNDVRDFNVDDIGKRVGTFARLGSDLFDHCIWYRSIGQCAAIVAQPYPHADDDHAREVAADHGLACHIPPHPRASFHVPGYTKFYVFTSLEHQIVWLPEQINGIAS